MNETDFSQLYEHFDRPIAALDCGARCAPYNERGVPFCCDTGHAVPTAYQAEWEQVLAGSGQWRPWQGKTPRETERIHSQMPDGQLPIVCQGHLLCRRSFRSITCRSFPFFPYITRTGEFIGMTYYWEYEDRCWVISNLDQVTGEYRREFIGIYDELFQRMPEEQAAFQHFSGRMRRSFAQRRRAIPLLHRNGFTYKVSPGSGRQRRVDPGDLPAFGPYQVARELPFPDEL